MKLVQSFWYSQCFVILSTILFVIFYSSLINAESKSRSLDDQMELSHPTIQLLWSYSGKIPGLYCENINEPSDPHKWHDNYLCSTEDIGLKWSYRGKIEEMHCYQVNEPSDWYNWHDNYLCVQRSAPIVFTWSYKGIPKGHTEDQCLQVNEPSDPHKWHDNWLCYRKREINQMSIIGYTDSHYGGTSNICLNNVKDALHRINGGKKDAHLFHWNPKTIFRTLGGEHAQGVARIPGLSYENWFVVSRGARRAGEILEFIYFKDIVSDGSPLANALIRNSDDGTNILSYDPPEHANNHAGGIQAVGKYLFVGSDGTSGSRVDIYDVSTLPSGGKPFQVSELLMGTLGETEANSVSAHWVAAQRLEDGRYLMVVGKDQRERGIFNGRRRKRTKKQHRAWFYISTTNDLEYTDWNFISFWDYAPIAERKAYQSANMLVQCDGAVYLAMMRPGRAKKNYIDLWRVDYNPENEIEPIKVDQKRIFKRRRKGRCTLNAGGGIHITPDSNDLVIYCSEKADRHDMQIDEYRDK